MLRVLVLTKRQYTNKDLLDDRFGRLREIPLHLARKGYEVKGLCLSYAPKGNGVVLDGPVIWESIDATPVILPGVLKFLSRSFQLAKNVDFIWACSDSFYGIIAYLVGRKLRVPVIFDLYDNFEYFLAAKMPGIKQLYQWVLRECGAVTCVSRPLAELVASYGRGDGIHVLENGVRRDLFKPMDKAACRARFGLPQEALMVGTAGDLHASRGTDHLFEAFFLLKDKHPSLHLLVAGPRRRGFLLPRDRNIHDLGVLEYEDVPAFVNALDVAVICNLENEFGRYCFPQKAREIMGCDIPLVAAGVGAMRELLHANPEWLYCPASSTDLARVLEHRLADKRTNYESVSSWSEVATHLEDILRAMSRPLPESLSGNSVP